MHMTGNYTDIDIQKQLDAPMLWIGMYVAAASLVCTLAMAADAFHGFRHRKFWFPCKYFSINATSLTLLTVSMKLPMDLTNSMWSVTDRLSKVSSLILMSTSMANFMTSLGSMKDKEIVMNVAALAILVITVTVNICIQIIQMHSFRNCILLFAEEILATACMFLLLVMLSSSAIMISSAKRYLDTKYHEKSKSLLHEENVKMGRFTVDKLRVLVSNCWLMAETSTPQFVIARSVTCTISGALSLLVALILMETLIRMSLSTDYRILNLSHSNYGWSTKWILLTQTIGVMVGTIAPACRWFIAVRSIASSNSSSSKGRITVEGYWTEKMEEWKKRSFTVGIQPHKYSRKIIHDMRGRILDFFILVQFLIVLSSKLIFLISIYIVTPLISCFNCTSNGSQLHEVSGLTANSEMNIRNFAMVLEDEQEIPTDILLDINKEIDKVIQRGYMQRPKDLIELLRKSCKFNGVKEFDSDQIPSLHDKKLPYCWSLPLVTLTTIALSLPNVEKQKSKFLLKSVTEGLVYVKLIDTNLCSEEDLTNIRNVADVGWVGIELHGKWQNKDLQERSLGGKNSKEILEELSNESEDTVLKFLKGPINFLMKNPRNWPPNIIAANAMCRISRTIFLASCDDLENQTDEELFDQLSTMISDIMAACFTNLGRLIIMKCGHNAIEERERIVLEAAILLGETKEILQLVQQHELPPHCLAPHRAAYIEDWRALLFKSVEE